VFTSDDDLDTLKMYKSLVKKLRGIYKNRYTSQACVYYESTGKQHIYLDKKNSWQGEYPIRDTQESIKLSVGQEGSFAVILSIQPIESSSEANNYELLHGENSQDSNMFWKLPGPIGADYDDYDYLLCQFVETLRKTVLMKKIRDIMGA